MTREGFGEELHIAHIDIEDHIDIKCIHHYRIRTSTCRCITMLLRRGVPI